MPQALLLGTHVPGHPLSTSQADGTKVVPTWDSRGRAWAIRVSGHLE